MLYIVRNEEILFVYLTKTRFNLKKVDLDQS